MIPIELTAYNQWILWRESAKPDGTKTKLPYSTTGGLASVSDKRTWSSYTVAVEAATRLNMGIGFVLTENDPFAFIDLDDPFKNNTLEDAQKIIERHQKIIKEFDTYTEISPSGTGLHLIPKGAVEGGRRRDKVEVYSSGRYMTMTGNTLHDKPIQDRGFLLSQLWKECGGGNGNGHGAYIEEKQQTVTDEEIYNQALKAENGEKFQQLWQGYWVDAGYKSQSEADFALINILSFYSRNVEQIKRLFFLSSLGQRDKAKRKTYIDSMVKRSFDNAPVYLPLDELKGNLLEQLKGNSAITLPEVSNPFAGPLFQNLPTENNDDWTMPPGLMGEIASFIYNSSPTPVKEVALAAAIGLMAGVCGRSYNISGTGLNQYVLLLARTGIGKDGLSSGVDKLMRYVRLKVPAAESFIGPTEIASGQALIKYLSKRPCFVSIVGEFGLTLQAICAYNANSSQIMLRKKLLELYSKSGEKNLLQPTIYSDAAKTTEVVRSPAFSLLGESTPESYYDGLDETMISQGLLPRFMAIEYLGQRPYLNKNHTNVEPSQQLVDSFCQLAENALVMAQNNRVLHIKLDVEAEAFSDKFARTVTDNINSSNITVARELWNRAHLKMLKLAALIAIGNDPYNPVVTCEAIQWAHILVNRDIENVFARFESGKIGKNTSEGHQIQEIIDVVKNYLISPYDIQMQKYLVDQRMHADKVVPLAYFHRRLQQKTAFRNDRMGATLAIKRSLDFLISDGAIQEVRQLDMFKRYEKTMKAYAITDAARFQL